MTYSEVLDSLDSLIFKDSTKKFSGVKGLDRVKNVLKLLNYPQEQYKAIHIAGTSGKGSTAFILSKLLQLSDFKVGLLLSPHIKDIRERISINGKNISSNDFKHVYQKIVSLGDKIDGLSYFEILTIMAYEYFFQQKVDYAVIETGLGGLLDATNCIERQDKISIITRIGLDHTHILGGTLEKITKQKAGIINPHSNVFVLDQNLKIIQEIENNLKGSKLHKIPKPKIISSPNNSARFIDFGELEVGLFGKHQLENSALSLSVFKFLSQRDVFEIDLEKIVELMRSLKFSGRFEIRSFRGHDIVLDGAHNPQKIRALVKAVNDKFNDRKKTYILSYKANKDVEECLAAIVKYANQIILTTFADNSQLTKPPAFDPHEMAGILDRLKFNNYAIAADLNSALDRAIGENTDVIIITGSMYLIGNLA